MSRLISDALAAPALSRSPSVGGVVLLGSPRLRRV